ncbi:MAG TPA: cyclase family protein [Ktedonobacteraceae bacterium]|nr:cyclase family protein [Ktedonobacteraceae bacterium]
MPITPDPFANYEWIDLSHTLEPGIPAWPTHARYGHILYESYEIGDIACQYQLVMSEHTGTHIDAPLHFIRGASDASEMPLERLAGRAATILANDLPPRGLLTAAYIQDWEERHAPIMPKDIVLISFGWEKYWGTGGQAQQFLQDWPGLGEDAAKYLVKKEVLSVGCDMLAIDAFGSATFPAHYTLLGNNVYIIENLKHLDKLPPFCLFFGFPLKVQGGSGSPIRAVALVEKSAAE